MGAQANNKSNNNLGAQANNKSNNNSGAQANNSSSEDYKMNNKANAERCVNPQGEKIELPREFDAEWVKQNIISGTSDKYTDSDLEELYNEYKTRCITLPSE